MRKNFITLCGERSLCEWCAANVLSSNSVRASVRFANIVQRVCRCRTVWCERALAIIFERGEWCAICERCAASVLSSNIVWQACTAWQFASEFTKGFPLAGLVCRGTRSVFRLFASLQRFVCSPLLCKAHRFCRCKFRSGF